MKPTEAPTTQETTVPYRFLGLDGYAGLRRFRVYELHISYPEGDGRVAIRHATGGLRLSREEFAAWWRKEE